MDDHDGHDKYDDFMTITICHENSEVFSWPSVQAPFQIPLPP
jgi:hypothetical protein